ncbi:BON domain-containing protein [Zavarzinella formosa]|uniref:BON domain-containing protein n=1 Tax=Zavarzinella formosa TaxID=360055 RepID=UPI0002FCB30A|nr:BON domain-containing protein [Zavarzinella formosa]
MMRLWLLAAVVALGVGANVHAQQTGGGGGGLGGNGGTGGFGGSSGGSLGGGTSLGTGGGSLGGSTGSTGATRTGAGGRSISSTAVSSTNFLAATYGNPLYPGRPGSTNLSISAGGGFGQATLPNTTNTRTTGTTGGVTGGSGRLGGTASVSGGSGTGSQNSTSRIQYSTTLDFPTRPVEFNELRSELRQMLDRSTSIRNPSRILVSVEGNTVVLTGAVSDPKEIRLVEGMVRLTPGVYSVRNELQEAP